MTLHRIHLRGPWVMGWINAERGSPHRVRLPAEWHDLFGAASGRVRLTRKFHQPTNLEPREEVDLVLHDWPGIWVVTLNQQAVGEFRDPSPARIAIKSLLQPVNSLTFETQIEPPTSQLSRPQLVGNVALEIRSD
jgi:hypothetical protein